MKPFQKLFSLVLLLAVMLSFAAPAHAFDGRSGDQVTIQEGDVINDDLYIGAQTLTMNGTVKGDLIVGAQTVYINGTVEGDLIAGAQTVIINGTIGDDARTFAAAVQVGSQAQIGGDLIAMGASVEVRQSSTVAADLVTGSGQTLLAGEVGGDVLAGTNALEIRGPVKGDVKAYVNINRETAGAAPMNMYLSNSPVTIPAVKPGLTLSDGASIGGNLDYTSDVELAIPAGIVAGKISRIEVSREVQGRPVAPRTPTSAERVADWGFGVIRSMVVLVLFGLLLGWLFPALMKLLPENLKAQPLISLGWGSILFAVVFFGLLVIILATILLAVFGLGWNIFWLGWLLLSALGITFLLVTSYLTKVVVGDAIGKWILGRFNPALVSHKVWPMVVGVAALVLGIGLLRFPLLPLGFFAWLVNFAVILFGLGAIWMWLRSAWASRKVTVS